MASNVFVMFCSNPQSDLKEIVQWTELKLPVAFWQKVKRDKLRTPSLMEMLCEDFKHTERHFLLKGSLRVEAGSFVEYKKPVVEQDVRG